jgi:hypothetical protein
MPETLLTPSGIKLYGRVVTDLQVNHASAAAGDNNFLRRQLLAGAAGNPRLARIYAFSFEGHHYDLPKPAIFLVHGAGAAPINYPAAGRTSDVESSGVAAKEWEFSFGDLVMWEYDKGDFSIRLDIETGPFEQILLEAALRGGSTLSSGADLRSSGADLRSSGADLRISGADLRNKR